MAFLNTLGAVSRHGQWRLSRVLRSSLPDGRFDFSDAGLIDFSTASEVVLVVVPRGPAALCGPGCEPAPVLTATSRDGSLIVSNPGVVEALFPFGWSRRVPPGTYDVRIRMTVGPETAVIFDQPVELR